MKLTGIKTLKSEKDVVCFLLKNKIPFEYRDNGDIVISRIDSYKRRDPRAELVSTFIDVNFSSVGRHGATNELLFCGFGFMKLYAKNEFTPEQIHV